MLNSSHCSFTCRLLPVSLISTQHYNHMQWQLTVLSVILKNKQIKHCDFTSCPLEQHLRNTSIYLSVQRTKKCSNTLKGGLPNNLFLLRLESESGCQNVVITLKLKVVEAEKHPPYSNNEDQLLR